MNTYKKNFIPKSRELTNNPVRVKYVEQASATPVAENVIGVCPECGSPLLGLEDRITCSRVEAGCIFTITVEEFENILHASLSSYLINVLTNVMSLRELLHDLGRLPERKFGMEFESLLECNVGIDLWIVKDYADVWTVGIAYEQYFGEDEG